MPKNIIICCDGTNNQFGSENTNVIRLIQCLDRKPGVQRLYYDPGVGTMPEPGMLPFIGKKISKWWELAFGRGLIKNVREAYSYLMDFWEPEAKVFLFGFSRGAFTVRVLAAMLHQMGLLPRGSYNLLPYAVRLFRSVSQGATSGSDNYWRLCNSFRWTFARDIEGIEQRRFPVHFIGLWDTVASVGWALDPPRFPYSSGNPSIKYVRHALAIDERRWFFRENLMIKKPGQDFDEQWFPGVHADVGGGYLEADGGLWRPPFQWILDEAAKQGLELDKGRINKVLNRTAVPTAPWNEPKHESLKGAWWLAEVFPKTQWQREGGNQLRVGLGRHRTIDPGAIMHESSLRRIHAGNYAPSNLSPAFIRHVQGLTTIPPSLACF